VSVKVTLNKYEVEICEIIAEKRRSTNRQVGILEPNLSGNNEDYSNLEIAMEREIDGVGAEFAFAKACNLYPEFNCEPRKGGSELVGRTRARIDVKQTPYPYGKLIAHSEKDIKKTDTYVLVIGKMPTFTIIGWCYSFDLVKRENWDTSLPKPAYSLTQDKLRKFGEKHVFKELLNDSRDWRTINI